MYYLRWDFRVYDEGQSVAFTGHHSTFNNDCVVYYLERTHNGKYLFYRSFVNLDEISLEDVKSALRIICEYDENYGEEDINAITSLEEISFQMPPYMISTIPVIHFGRLVQENKVEHLMVGEIERILLEINDLTNIDIEMYANNFYLNTLCGCDYNKFKQLQGELVSV